MQLDDANMIQPHSLLIKPYPTLASVVALAMFVHSGKLSTERSEHELTRLPRLLNSSRMRLESRIGKPLVVFLACFEATLPLSGAK